jgi:hypothetical protein
MNIKAWFTFPIAVPSGSDIDPGTSLPYDRLERTILDGEGVLPHVTEIVRNTNDPFTPRDPARYTFRVWFTEAMPNAHYAVLIHASPINADNLVCVKYADCIDLYIDLADLQPGELEVVIVGH